MQIKKRKEEKEKIEEMLNTIKAYGITDKAVFKAMRNIPRSLFVEQKELAYEDMPLQTKRMQTISQPYTVAFMLFIANLKKGHKVLEIGTGTGWNIALIKELIGKEGEAISIEYFEELAELAKENLKKLSIDATIICSDGSEGFKLLGPYDRIIITAACPEIPKHLIGHLKDNGIIVAPVGRLFQKMIKITKEKSKIKIEDYGSFRFVPLLGKKGFRY